MMGSQKVTTSRKRLVEWILRTMEELKISQATLAEESGVSRPWINQFLSFRRIGVRPERVAKVQHGLQRLIEQRAQSTDQKVFMLQEAGELFQGQNARKISLSQPDILRLVADVLTLLVEKCPDPSEQIRVVDQLRVCIQAETEGD